MRGKGEEESTVTLKVLSMGDKTSKKLLTFFDWGELSWVTSWKNEGDRLGQRNKLMCHAVFSPSDPTGSSITGIVL